MFLWQPFQHNEHHPVHINYKNNLMFCFDKGHIYCIVLVLSLHFLLSSCDLVGDQVVLGLFHGASTSIGYLVGLAHWRLPTTGTVLALLVILREIATPHFLVRTLVNTS